MTPRAGRAIGNAREGTARGAAALVFGLLATAWLAGATPARAELMQPDPSYKDAQFDLRAALKDTVGQSENPVRLDTLGVALLRLNRYADAKRVFAHVLALKPGDDAAEAGLGKLALWNDQLAEAESLLAGGLDGDPTAVNDLLATRVRRGEWTSAAALADSLGQTGYAELLRRHADGDLYQKSGANEAKIMLARVYPVPLVRVKLNGQLVLMSVETGTGDLLIDDYFARQLKLQILGSQRPTLWNGDYVSVRNALVQRLDLGGVRVANVPAGIVKTGRWSVEVNPQGEHVAGVIGLNLLRQFTPTLDLKQQYLELRPLDAAPPAAQGASRVPFEIWGENELTVYGSMNGGRRMAFALDSGIPGCGVAAPPEVFEEIGIKAGVMTRMVAGAGSMLHGRPWNGVQVSAVTIGPLAKDKVQGWSGAIDSSELWRHGVRRDAALSNDFLRGRRVTFDWAKRELVVEGD